MSKLKGPNNHKRFPTAIQRIGAARAQLPHSTILQGLERDVKFILDPSVAKQIFFHHELKFLPQNTKDDDNLDIDIHQYSYADLQKPTKPTKLLRHALTNANGEEWKRQRFCVSRAFAVEKSFRQSCANYAMQRTMQLVLEYEEKESKSTLRCSRGKDRPWISSLWCRIKSKNMEGMDVRYMSKEIAIFTMTHVVLGSGSHSCHGDDSNGTRAGSIEIAAPLNDVIDSLRDMLTDSLETHRDESTSRSSMKKVERLQQSVKAAFEVILARDENLKEGQKVYDCLARRLLKYEMIMPGHDGPGVARPVNNSSSDIDSSGNSDDSCNEDNSDNGEELDRKCEFYLTRDEVLSNCHSALLAGTQTMCTTLTSALAHLAERDDIQSKLRSNHINNEETKQGQSIISESESDSEPITARDVINESLRILPPVGGLPRYPTKCNLNVHHMTDSSSQTEPIATDTLLAGSNCGISQCTHNIATRECTIGKCQMMVVDLLALSHAQPPHTACNTQTSTSTLTFNPRHKSRSKSHAQPWGIGRRKCPAGIITMECLISVIDTLTRRGITWKLVDPENDSVEKDGCGGWMKSISYRPTLSFGRSIRIYFEKQDGI